MVIFIFIRGILLNQRIFFFKAPTSVLQVIFYRFGQILFNLARILQCIVKKALFLCFLRSVLITYLITWGLEKKTVVFLLLLLLLLLFLFSVRTPCLVGQSCSLYRTEGIRLEIIMSIEKKSIELFLHMGSVLFSRFVSHSLQTLQAIILSHYLVRIFENINRMPFALFYAYL